MWRFVMLKGHEASSEASHGVSPHQKSEEMGEKQQKQIHLDFLYRCSVVVFLCYNTFVQRFKQMEVWDGKYHSGYCAFREGIP